MNLIESMQKNFYLSSVDISVYMPPVLRAVRLDSRTTDIDAKNVLARHGLMISDDRIKKLVGAARYVEGFVQSI